MKEVENFVQKPLRIDDSFYIIVYTTIYMNKEKIEIRKHRRNAMATRVISAVLCVEQGIYGSLFVKIGSMQQKIYFFSALVVGAMFLATYLLPLLYKPKTGLFLGFAEMVPLAVGMTIAYLRMIYAPEPFRSIPTIYMAVLFGGAVVFMLSYQQSAILYGLFIILSILGVESVLKTDSTIPFKADFLINGVIAWAVSAINYRAFLSQQEQKVLIEEQNAQLIHLSERDWLTGIFNRRKLDESIQKAMLSHPDPCPYTSLILFDLDFFKQINDCHGHQAGDNILKELVRLVSKQIQEDEMFGRWGGEEFMILAKRNGKQVAENIRKTVQQASFPQGVNVTASFGVCDFEEVASAQLLMKAVDKALYRAKEQGRNQVVVSSC